MIQAQDLKHGNYFYFGANKDIGRVWIDDEFKYYVEFKDMSNEMLEHYTQSEIQPIPLTPDILEKCGWLWNEECKSYEKYPNGDARMNLRQSWINGSWEMFNYVLQASIAKGIAYLHRVQNLHFALTTQELPINL